MCYRLSFVALAIALCPMGTRADEPGFAVIGYLPEYRIANIAPERLAPITDLVYFGLEPPADGRLSDSPIVSSVLKKLQEIKRVAKCRVLISVGGWDRSKGFSALARTDATRQRFIAGLLAYCQNNKFDGIDYDWEHPKGAKELAAYRQLLSDTAVAFHDAGLLVTVAQAGWQNLGKQAYDAVDRVHLMSYDHEFPQATFDKSKADVDRLIGWGCAPEKIAMGLPFYGRNKKREARTYRELVGERAIDPNADTIDGFAFNGRATIILKVNLAIKRNLSGIMIWELGQDASRKEASLLTTINQQLRLPTFKQRIKK